MKRTKMIVAGLVVGVLVTAGVFAVDSEILGRDVAGSGVRKTLTGTLVTEDQTEWSLQTAEGLYVLHLGPPSFREPMNIGLREGKQITVYGFVQGLDVAPISLEVDSQRFAFRGEDGRPLWAGTAASRGMGWNRDADGAQDRSGMGSGRREVRGVRGEGRR